MNRRLHNHNALRLWVKYASFGDARGCWIFLLLLFVYVGGCIDIEASFKIAALVAVFSCIVALKSVRYNLLSFVSISVFGHVIAFPLAAFLAMSLSVPTQAIESYIWASTPAAMWACSVGMLGLATGSLLVNVIRGRMPISERKGRPWIPPASKNLVLILIILPIVALYIQSGFYYHKGVTGFEEYNVAAAKLLGFVGYFTYLSYAGVVLQIRRYTLTRATIDGVFAVIYTLIMLAVFIPSGSRAQALVVLPLALITYLAWEKQAKKRITVLAITVCLFIVLALGMEFYRIVAHGVGARTLTEQVQVLKDRSLLTTASDNENKEFGRIMLARRLADYAAVGYVMSLVPSEYPYRLFEDVDEWIVFLLPTLIRPETGFNFSDGAVVCDRYGFRAGIGGSSPLMTIGDLYSRFGWPGIFLGMMLIGMIFRSIDFWIERWRVFDIILFTFLFQQVVTLLNETLLRHFIYFTKNIAIIIVISHISTLTLRSLSRYKFVFRRDSCRD